jgi:hypothetical protein
LPTADEHLPRHRRPGRAHKRGRTSPGRRIRSGPPADDDPPTGTYPVEDLAGLSPGAAALLLQRARIDAEAGAPTCPHLVITRDVRSDVITYSGPFDSGLVALSVAHDFLTEQRAVDPTWEFTLTVAPLFEQ